MTLTPMSCARFMRAAWARFARGSDNPQRSLWEAHQVSIEQGASLCVGLLDQEVVSERAFATFALAVVADSARQLAPTDGAMLGEFTKRHYPPDHPITAPQLDVLKSRLAPGDA